MNIISITHANDIDGIGSSALIRMKYGVPLKNFFFTDYSKARLSYVEDSILRILRNGKIDILFLTDLGINKAIVPRYIRIISGVKKKGGKVVWFDHHMWDKDEIREVAGRCDLAVVGENKRYCGAEITYRNLKVPGAFAKRLVDLIHYSDFNLDPKDPAKTRLIGIYAMSIMLYNTFEPYAKRDEALRQMVGVLSGSRFTDGKIMNSAKAFDRINRKKTNEMLRNLYRIGSDVCLGFAENIQSTWGCAAIMEKTGCEMAIYVNVANGTGHLRSKRRDTTMLARHFGGGGHPHASGFAIKMARFNYFKTENDKKKFVAYLEKTINSLY